MAFIDYYKTLDISKTDSEKEVKAAYRKLARKYHPDLNPNDKNAEKKFKEVNEANEVLSDPENRKKYDRYGENWKQGKEHERAQQAQRSQYRQSNQQGYSNSGDDFSDFFGSMFGGAGESSRPGRNPQFKGQDYNAELHLELKDVYTSQAQILTVNGKKIRITIPAGVENGQVIKIKGMGAEGRNGGPKGDLYITFVLNNDTQFKRVGNNLYSNVSLDLYTAILGGEVVVDTFDNKVKLSITPETKNDTKVKLKGKGFPVYKNEGTFGDLIVTYQLKIPSELNEQERVLFKELQNIRKGI
jgi:curved DNA-binding protein